MELFTFIIAVFLLVSGIVLSVSFHYKQQIKELQEIIFNLQRDYMETLNEKTNIKRS